MKNANLETGQGLVTYAVVLLMVVGLITGIGVFAFSVVWPAIREGDIFGYLGCGGILAIMFAASLVYLARKN